MRAFGDFTITITITSTLPLTITSTITITITITMRDPHGPQRARVLQYKTPLHPTTSPTQPTFTHATQAHKKSPVAANTFASPPPPSSC
jgi:hypothetical protein